ncbi:MAG: lipoprotein signal peptidase [Candidatus Sericytochromatia bacterium]|nr:MAG: lipoprotein signal peptidase [Candidatus Sericytochromatia bacterium]
MDSKKFHITVLITYFCAGLAFFLDYITKEMVKSHFPNIGDYKVIFDWLWFTHVVNYGAAFSSFYGQRLLLSIFASVISIGIIVYERKTYKTRTKLLSASLGFLLGGALGNLYDRILYGKVTDFLDLRWAWDDLSPIVLFGKTIFSGVKKGDNIWAIFNVADICINIGIGLLILYFIFQEGKENKKVNKKENEVKI